MHLYWAAAAHQSSSHCAVVVVDTLAETRTASLRGELLPGVRRKYNCEDELRK